MNGKSPLQDLDACLCDKVPSRQPESLTRSTLTLVINRAERACISNLGRQGGAARGNGPFMQGALQLDRYSRFGSTLAYIVVAIKFYGQPFPVVPHKTIALRFYLYKICLKKCCASGLCRLLALTLYPSQASSELLDWVAPLTCYIQPQNLVSPWTYLPSDYDYTGKPGRISNMILAALLWDPAQWLLRVKPSVH